MRSGSTAVYDDDWNRDCCVLAIGEGAGRRQHGRVRAESNCTPHLSNRNLFMDEITPRPLPRLKEILSRIERGRG